tara:strand:- start:12 stop:419 length:408 start_codon:yes stop_codon:yes gene_type:complete
MNRDILPLVDNDVLTIIGKEVIKIRDKKTLEYWMEFYTTRRLRLINNLYPTILNDWRQVRLIINTYTDATPSPWFPQGSTKWDVIKDLDYYGVEAYEREIEIERDEEQLRLHPLTEEDERLYREGFGSPDSDGAY